jgi:hypothetical protein
MNAKSSEKENKKEMPIATMIVAVTITLALATAAIVPLPATATSISELAQTEEGEVGADNDATAGSTYDNFKSCLSDAEKPKGYATQDEITDCYNPIYKSSQDDDRTTGSSGSSDNGDSHGIEPTDDNTGYESSDDEGSTTVENTGSEDDEDEDEDEDDW